MIEVENLSKTYAGFRAVQNISFKVGKGEIVGFLGPNGAGKSTTMRVLAGYLPPTDGRVRVAGFDVVSQSLEVRRRIGYMPENVPLYTDMRVDEFLRFRAQIKGVPARRMRARIDSIKQLCGLENVGRKLIGHLSKGYRQRVGLADALVHEPDLLILDEPTIGLDPNQIRSVRELIKDLGQRHTILLSTHILSEVEMTCSRVLIIHRGRIEASDTPANLTRVVRGGGNLRLLVRAQNAESIRQGLQSIAEVEDVEIKPAAYDPAGWFVVQLYTKAAADVRDAVYATVQKQGWGLREMARERATLEEAFVELTHD